MTRQANRKWPFSVVLTTILAIAVLTACGQSTSGGTTATSLMPNLAGYQITDTLSIQDAIAKVGSVASLGAGQPEVTALIAAVSGVAACYQKVGAVKGQAYVNSTDALKAGLIVIVDRNMVADPATILNCVMPKSAALKVGQVQPCAKAYTYNADNNQFYIAYAATNPEVCQAFCSALKGCTQ